LAYSRIYENKKNYFKNNFDPDRGVYFPFFAHIFSPFTFHLILLGGGGGYTGEENVIFPDDIRGKFKVGENV